MTEQITVVVSGTLNPDPIEINAGDLVVWQNNTAAVQTASSDDGGETFTTGPVQQNANSLPIVVPQTTTYTVTPAGLHGNITVDAGFHFANNQVAGTATPTIAITSPALPSGTVGKKYKRRQLTATGGTPPFKWSVSPELPNGLSLGESGTVSGTPNEAVEGKTYTFSVVDGNSKSASKTLNLSIGPAQSAQPATKKSKKEFI